MLEIERCLVTKCVQRSHLFACSYKPLHLAIYGNRSQDPQVFLSSKTCAHIRNHQIESQTMQIKQWNKRISAQLKKVHFKHDSFAVARTIIRHTCNYALFFSLYGSLHPRVFSFLFPNSHILCARMRKIFKNGNRINLVFAR